MRDRLIAFLVEQGIYPPEEKGYGQVTADSVADALIQAGWVRETLPDLDDDWNIE